MKKLRLGGNTVFLSSAMRNFLKHISMLVQIFRFMTHCSGTAQLWKPVKKSGHQKK